MSARSALQNFAAFLKSVCDTAAGETAGIASAAKATQTIHARFIGSSLMGIHPDNTGLPAETPGSY
jgi:hypothetical protein